MLPAHRLTPDRGPARVSFLRPFACRHDLREIDLQSAPAPRDELLRVIRRRGPQITIDLDGVTFLDCADLNVLLATRRRTQLEGGSVRPVRVPRRVRRIVSLLNLDRAFGLDASTPGALPEHEVRVPLYVR
jgi:anti-anti-sigma factor